jgi:type IV pilus assembly protein PilC
LSLFVHELLSLLKAGLPVAEALELSSDRQGEPTLEKIIISVLKAVHAGSTLSEAFSMHKDKLDELFVSVLKTGEKSGNLPAALEQYLIYLGSRIKLSKKLKQAMAYPLFLSLSLLAILGVMFFFVMPRFASMYANFGAQLPAPTQMLMDMVSNIPAAAISLLILIIGAAASYRTLNANPVFRKKLEKIKFSIPLAGSTYELYMISRVARSLAILVSSGTPLVDSLRTIRESISNATYASRIEAVEDAILGGKSLTNAISEIRLMPKTAVKLVRAGEASGNLGEMLSEVADYYHDMLDARLERIMALIEPLLIMVMGLIVGAVIIIMYLPIFKLAEVV